MAQSPAHAGCQAARFFGWDVASPHFNFSGSGELAAAAHRLANDTAAAISNLTEALTEHHKLVPSAEKKFTLPSTNNFTDPKFTIPAFNFSWILKDGANMSIHLLPTYSSGLLGLKGNFTHVGNFTGNHTGLLLNKTLGAGKVNISPSIVETVG